MKQGSRTDFEQTTQGKYAATADGTLLGETNHFAAERILKMMNAALDEFEPTDIEAIAKDTIDDQFARVAPENGLVVRVHCKILGGYEEPENERQRIFQQSIARDNLWITEQEKRTLINGEFPKALAVRLARFNLVDNTRGEPPMWDANEIVELEISARDGVIRGSVHVQTENKKRGFKGEVFGHLDSQNGSLVRLDLVAKGEFWGNGTYTRKGPEGKFPIAMTFRLADGTDPADKVAPQGTKGWLPNYW